MKSEIRLGMAALTNDVFVGYLCKDGRTWKQGKHTVTSDFLQTMIQYVGVNKSLEINVGGKPKYVITVKELPELKN
jgi:hypothetical protein